MTDNGSPALNSFETISIVVTLDTTPIQAVLLPFTSQWRYNTNGANLLTAWKETGYDDSVWPLGNGAFHNETGSVVPVPTNTFLPLTGVTGQRVTNYYFRTKFSLPAAAAGVTLSANMALDDGAVIYINGVEVQRINMAAGTVLATTFAASSWEANVLFNTNVSAAPLVAGENTLAVEVHQQSPTSSDVVFDLQLNAIIPSLSPVAITQQPVSVAVTSGSPATFSVGTAGSYPFYQWFKDGSPIAGARSATHTIPGAQAADAGQYSVHVSNLVSRVTSASATLTVNAAVPRPQITSITNNAGTITIQWSSVPTHTYRVEYKGDLNAATWTQVGGIITATGTTSSITDTIAADVRRFYRVVLTN